MKREAKKEKKLLKEEFKNNKITRKEAIRKAGYVALSAATLMVLLSSSARGNTSSPASPPDGF